jgi:hypothetical protein
MTKVELLKKDKNNKVFQINELLFPAAMWFSSRLLIWIVMLGIAPLLQAPSGGIAATFDLEVFYAWDSIHYRDIATTGYEYINDGKGHNVAFFPLFPLIIKFLMNFGLPFKLAGFIVNNLAFLGAIYCVYFWVKSSKGNKEARWATAVLAWCPPSMYAGVIYTEGLYLFLSAAAMLLALGKYGFFWSRYLRSIDTWQATREAIALVKTKEAVLTTRSIVAHLTHRQKIQFVDDLSGGVPDLTQFKYILLNVRHPYGTRNPEFTANLVNQLKNNQLFELVKQRDEVYLFVKNYV